MKKKPIYVTKPYLPPLAEFIPYLEEIWSSRVLTNGGSFHQRLEEALCSYLNVPYISLFSNGTLALITALQALQIEGEVITTPYSFVATTHSMLWRQCTPVFVDIDPKTLNLDPALVESAITKSTRAIMPVHCYGTPCNVQAIQEIADQHQLHVIYDAAHAFGVTDGGGSVLRHGDLSVISFHATKVFNTFEGGAVISHDKHMKEELDRLKNFGFIDETTVASYGLNAKMSEINAAMGLLQLKHMPDVLANRHRIDSLYRQHLSKIRNIQCVPRATQAQDNYAYFPILIGDNYSLSRDHLAQLLQENGIYARRYFYPLISDFPMYKSLPSSSSSNLPHATKIATAVLCLPIYPELSNTDVMKIVKIISENE